RERPSPVLLLRGIAVQPNPATAEDPRSVLRRACAELERRLRAGEDCHAEQFLAAYPVLASDPDRALELIQTEWLRPQAPGRGGGAGRGARPRPPPPRPPPRP